MYTYISYTVIYFYIIKIISSQNFMSLGYVCMCAYLPELIIEIQKYGRCIKRNILEYVSTIFQHFNPDTNLWNIPI